MANFTPQTEQDIIKAGLIPAKTICDIEVISATDKKSKSDNDMIELQIKAFYENKTFVIFDYITFGSSNAEQFKLRRSCDTFGILDAYNSGQVFADDYKGKAGKAKISISTDKNGQYPDRNGIGEYIARPIAAQPLNDEVPF